MKKINVRALGHNGPIDFVLKLNNNSLEDIEVTKHTETPGIFKQVFDNLRDSILDNQSFQVDAISGATVMSQAILDSGENAVENAGIKLDSKSKISSKENQKINSDVVVIGSGGAGLVAACRMLDLGKRVVLLEKNGYLGGATILNGSNVTATNSKKAQAIFGNDSNKDSPELLASDVADECLNTNDSRLTKLMTENIGSAIDFISDFADLPYQKAQTQTPEHSVQRQVELPSSSSFEFIQKVSNAFKKKGGKIYLDARVEEILMDEDQQVTGVKAESRSGSLTVNAPAVIIATGGYGANQKMRGEESQGIDYYGPQTSTGDAYEFLKPLDPKSTNIGWYKIYPHGVEVEPGIAKLTTYASKKATDMGAIYVNSDGKRIVNESDVYAKFRNAVLKQPDKIAFLIMDKRTWESFYNLLILHDFSPDEIEGYFKNEGEKAPIFVKGSLAHVCQKAGINFDNLQETMHSYEKAVKRGKDTEFDRSAHWLHSYEGEEYYVVEQRDRFATTLGGLVTTSELQLQRKNNKTIPNIWCVGEVVGGANGHDSMPSMMNTWSFSSGYFAANKIFSYLQKSKKDVVKVKNVEFGSGRPKVAVPLTAKTEDDLIDQAKQINGENADLVEWRLDSFQNVEDEQSLKQASVKLRQNLPDLPVLATFRTVNEGGNYTLNSDKDYFQICRNVVINHLADLMDLELKHDQDTLKNLISLAKKENIKIIMSNHNFEKTDSKEEIVHRLSLMEKLGADIAKIATMPNNSTDVLKLLEATDEAKSALSIPLITMSMGDIGKISRVSGEIFGSCLTFGTVGQSSAPGQIESKQLFDLLDVFKLTHD